MIRRIAAGMSAAVLLAGLAGCAAAAPAAPTPTPTPSTGPCPAAYVQARAAEAAGSSGLDPSQIRVQEIPAAAFQPAAAVPYLDGACVLQLDLGTARAYSAVIPKAPLPTELDAAMSSIGLSLQQAGEWSNADGSQFASAQLVGDLDETSIEPAYFPKDAELLVVVDLGG